MHFALCIGIMALGHGHPWTCFPSPKDAPLGAGLLHIKGAPIYIHSNLELKPLFLKSPRG